MFVFLETVCVVEKKNQIYNIKKIHYSHDTFFFVLDNWIQPLLSFFYHRLASHFVYIVSLKKDLDDALVVFGGSFILERQHLCQVDTAATPDSKSHCNSSSSHKLIYCVKQSCEVSCLWTLVTQAS